MRAIMRLSESNTETNVKTGTNKKKLKHKVIYGLDKKLPIRSSSRWILSVCAKVLPAILNVNWGQAIIKIRSEILHQAVNAYLKNRKLTSF
jgi:hypothetical protein